MYTSPSAMVPANFRNMLCTWSPKVPVKSVMPLFWATSWPWASVTPQAKSRTS